MRNNRLPHAFNGNGSRNQNLHKPTHVSDTDLCTKSKVNGPQKETQPVAKSNTSPATEPPTYIIV